MMVHDIKAPMAGVSLMIETLLEENLSREVKQRLAGMGESIEELLGHLYNVLTISKIEKGPFDPSNRTGGPQCLRGLCQFPVSGHGRSKRDQDFGGPGPGLCRPCRADEFYLERLIYNLLINAIHWTPRGGWINIKTGSSAGRRKKDESTLEVADNGPGISPEQKPDLFKKFISHPEKGDLTGTHSGLGLHISQTIIQAHGGDAAGRGKTRGRGTICLYFPHSPKMET